jgi:hypothetical protein
LQRQRNYPPVWATLRIEFDGNTYYLTPGEFVYRKDPGWEKVGGFFCGYLTDEVWHYRTDDG